MKKMNSLLKGGFQPVKCKTQLRLGTSRIKLLKNKKTEQIKRAKEEVAELLRNDDQEGNAQIRVEHVIRDQNLIDAYDLLSLYAERIAAQLSVIDAQKPCPPELKEAISTLLFASSRCAELPDFAQIQPMFQAKYGKEFVSAAVELRPGCGVNERVIEKLSVSPAPLEAKLEMMMDIAGDYNVPWDPARFERGIEAVSDDPLELLDVPPIDDFPSVPNQKPTLGNHLAQSDNSFNPNLGRFMKDDREPTNSPHPVDDHRTVSQGARSGPPTRFMEDKVGLTNSPRLVDDNRMNSQGARSGPPLRIPPGREQSRTDDLSFNDRLTDMDPERRETQPRRNSRRESDSFSPLASQARHQDDESRRNSIGVPREKSGRVHTAPSFGGMDESLPLAKNDRRESQGAEIDVFDGSHRSDRRQSRKYDHHEGHDQVQDSNAERSSYMKNPSQVRTSQEGLIHASDEDELGAFAKTRPSPDGGRRNQARQDKELEEAAYSAVFRKEGSGRTKPRNQDQDFEEDYYKKVPSREGSGKARGQYQDQESDEHNLKRADRREGLGKEWPYHEDNYAEQQHLKRASSKEGSHGRISGRDEGKLYTEKYRRHDDSEEDSDHVLHRIDEPRRRDPSKNTPKYVDENFHNTTKTSWNGEDEYRESGKGTRRDSSISVKMDNEKSISDRPRDGFSEYDDDRQGGGARKSEARHNFKGTSTRNSDRSSESREEGSHQRTQRTHRSPSVEDRRRDALEDPGSSRGNKYGREDPDALKASSGNRRLGNDPLDFDDDNFTTSSKADRRMSLPGGSVRDKSKFQGNRASNDYDDTERPSGRRVTIGPEEIHPVRGPETEEPPRSKYGEREKYSDKRQPAPFLKGDSLEGRQSPNYSSQRDRSERPSRFSNPKVGSQASPDDEHSRNTRAQMDRSDRPRKSDIAPKYDGDKPPPRFIKTGKQLTSDDEDMPTGRSSPGFKGEKPQRFVNSPRHSEKPLPPTPRPRSNLQSVKTDPDLSAKQKTPAPEHRKSQSTSASASTSDGVPQSQPQPPPAFKKPPDLDDLIQMFGKKGKK